MWKYKQNTIYIVLKRLYHIILLPIRKISGTIYEYNVCKWMVKYPFAGPIFEHNLNENSIVFDVWWHIWLFSDWIIDKFDPYIYIFEPVNEYYNLLTTKYKNNPKVKIFEFGFSDINKSIDIYRSWDLGEWTSIYKKSDNVESIKLVDIGEFLEEQNITKIDLFSINIEGWEYEVIPRLIETNKISLINIVQIQFHDFVEWANNKRQKIMLDLRKTHSSIIEYEFVRDILTKIN